VTSLYVHIPFCHNKCYFCSFVIAVGKEHHVDSYLDCIEKEAGFYHREQLKTVYVGGGTPSLINGSQLTRLVGIIKEKFFLLPGCEFVLEANPATFDYSKAELIHDLGINRLSLGVQSLNDQYLKFLGRPHNAADARSAFEILRKVGFTNINLDLMYSFPGQTKQEIEEDARGIVGFGSEHLSLYTLTIEKGSRFFKKNFAWQDGFSQGEQYVLIVDTLESLGVCQYEISNFAKTGKESEHNMVYWRGGNYIGLGVGAHSHWNGKRYWNTSNLMEYIHKLQENQKPIEGQETLTPRQRFKETLLFNLRMNAGADVSALEKRFECALFAEDHEMLQGFVADGFLKREGSVLKTTAAGRLVLDELSARLI